MNDKNLSTVYSAPGFAHPGFHSTAMVVTPRMAEEWLEKNAGNRALNQKRVAAYAKDMRNGEWVLHHQGVAFYSDGSFADGQHRLAAIVLSGIAVPMMVTYGIERHSGLFIDSHQQRQAHQAIHIAGSADWIGQDEVAVIRVLARIEQLGLSRISNSEIVHRGERFKSSIQFGIAALPSKKRHITTAATRAAIGIASKHEDSSKLLEFAEVLHSGMPKTESDKAAVLLREQLIAQRGMGYGGEANKLTAVKKTMRAIKAFCQEEVLHRLYAPEYYIYEAIADHEEGEGAPSSSVR